MQRILFILFYFLFAGCNTSRGQSIKIVADQTSKGVIVIAKNASDQVRNSALLLQKYIFKSTNAKLQISNEPIKGLNPIFLGISKYSAKSMALINSESEDAFIIRILPSSVTILGNSDWGSEYGVYAFLEKYIGVHWLMPTDLGIDVPLKKSIILQVATIIQSPAFKSRHLSPINVNGKKQLDIWGRRNRIRKTIEFSHNMNKLFNVRKYGKSNPIFYSSYQKNQKIPSASDFNWQPNFSAKGIVDSAAKTIIEYFKKNPNKNSYSLGMNDSKEFVQIKNSIKGGVIKKNILGLPDASNLYYIWANSVAKHVTKVIPNKKFGTLAYSNLIQPPSKDIGVNSSIIPFITSERLRWANKKFQSDDIRLTRSWTDQCKEIGWYDYDYGLCYLIPRIWSTTMQKYLLWGNNNGVKYYVAELYPNFGDGPKNWIISKLLWNPNLNVDSLRKEWCVAFAGHRSAKYLEEYFKIWENYWTIDIQKLSWYNLKRQFLQFTNLKYLSLVTNQMVKQCDKLLFEAKNHAVNQIQRDRIEKIIQMWKIYRRAIYDYKKFESDNYNSFSKDKILVEELKAIVSDPILGSSASRILKYVLPKK